MWVLNGNRCNDRFGAPGMRSETTNGLSAWQGLPQGWDWNVWGTESPTAWLPLGDLGTRIISRF